MKQAGLIYYLNQPVLNLVSLVASNKFSGVCQGNLVNRKNIYAK